MKFLIFILSTLIINILTVDAQPPGYSNFDFNPKALTNDEKLTVSVTLTDEDSGIKYAIVSFITFYGTSIVDCRLSPETNLVSGDILNGTYESNCTVELPSGVASVEANATLVIFDRSFQMTSENNLGVLSVTNVINESQNRDLDDFTSDNSSSSSSSTTTNYTDIRIFMIITMLFIIII